ncbi:flagellar hook-basal body complex protein, partial [Steroidobacter agaridevorans]
MDALIFTLMSGAERSMRAQQIHANNLANLETGGFRADLELATSKAVNTGYGYDARHMSQLQANSVASREGVLRQTGQDLDVAVSGQGYFAVQFGEGEAYTRAGHFVVDQDGQLMLDGRAVLGDGGPIVLPQFSRVQIASDGVISIEAPGSTEMQEVDRLRLVKPDAAEVTKNPAG